MTTDGNTEGRDRDAHPGTAGNLTMSVMILVTAVPFALALLLLHLLGPERGPDVGIASLSEGHIHGLITFCTAAVAQVAACLAAIFLFARILGTTPVEIRRRALQIGVPLALAVLLALALMPDHGGAAGRLTFRFFGDLFALSGADWLHVDSGLWIPSRLFLAYFLPSAFGVVAVVAAAVALAALVRAMPSPDSPTWKTSLGQSHATVRRVVYMLTLILVLSTFAASLFFHLPVELFVRAARGDMARFAQELSIFWGTVYSLTLIATVAPAILLLQQGTRRGVEVLAKADAKAAAEAQALLDSNGLIASLRQKVELVLALLAPMIAGPVANAFQAALVP